MTVHAIYASTSGNVEIVVETAAAVLKSQGIDVQLHRAEQTDLSLVQSNDCFILATSTWEHGQLNPFFKRLYDELKAVPLAGKRACFVGLGDLRYDHVLFNQGMKLVRGRWLEQGGQEFHRQLLINGEPYHILATTVTDWAQALSGVLLKETVEPHHV